MQKKMIIAFLLLMSITAPAQQKEVLLWTKGAPGSEGQTGMEKIRVVEGDQVIKNIHHPSITPYLPAKEKLR